MKLAEADRLAGQIVAQLAPHCVRIQVAGSVRRRRPEVGDIEVVAIPKPYDVGLFRSGIATVVDQWPKVRGELPCKYTQRQLPEGSALDLFLVTRRNWGLQLAIRTGSAAYSHQVLARGWRMAGYESRGGILHHPTFGEREVLEEEELFRLIGRPWVPPEQREVE